MTQKSKIAILECLEYVISLFPETNRGYNASRPYRKALKEFIRDNNLDHERKENTIPDVDVKRWIPLTFFRAQLIRNIMQRNGI